MSATKGTNSPTRDPRDFYRTPAWCVRELYATMPGLPAPTLDPCAGTGALLRAAPAPPSMIRGIELDPELVKAAGLPNVTQGDGLAAGWGGEHILMNPPYRDALSWIEKGVREANSVLALLRLGFMGAQSRLPFWRHHPPRALVTLSKRPSFTGGATDSADYAWFFWTKDRALAVRPGLATLAWITDSRDNTEST